MTGSEVFDRLLQLVCNVFDSYSAVLFLPAADGESCVLRHFFSLGDDVRAGQTLAPGQGLVGWIVKEGKPLLIGNFDQKRGVLGYYAKGAEAQIKAFLGCPLQGVAGALCLDSKKVHSFGEKDQKILAEFAALASQLYLERDGLEDRRAETRLWANLGQLSLLPRRHPKWSVFLRELLALLSRASGFGHCFLAVRDDTAGVFHIEGASQALFAAGQPVQTGFPLGGGMIGWVFKNDAPVFADEGDTTSARLFGAPAPAPLFHAVLCQPVFFSRRTRAVLVLANQSPARIGEALKDFARTAGDQLALFLENLHLKAKLSRKKDQQA